jgi:hypothetical protein
MLIIKVWLRNFLVYSRACRKRKKKQLTPLTDQRDTEANNNYTQIKAFS